MALQEKLKMIMVAANLNNRKMAAAFGCSPNTAAAKFQRGIVRLDDVVKIVTACGATLTITTKDGLTIPLTLEDVEPKKKE